MSSFLDFQILNGATISPALIHKVYTGPVPTNLESQGRKGKNSYVIKHKPPFVEHFHVCVCVVSVAGSHDLQVSLFTGHRSIYFFIMWNLKGNYINELIYKTETDSQTWRMNL